MELCNIAIVVEKAMKLRRAQSGINSFERYAEEILNKLRIPFHMYGTLDDALGAHPDIIIGSLVADTGAQRTKLLAFAEAGGTIVAYGGLNHLAAELGYAEGRGLGVGYARLPEHDRPIRFLNAIPWLADRAVGSQAASKTGVLHHVSPEGEESGVALLSIQIGKGGLERWAIDIPSTIVALQQGTGPVIDDGAAAADGTIDTRDDTLKADDRCAMDWEYDRLETSTNQTYYAYPYADWWNHTVIRHLLGIAVRIGKTLPFLDYWPIGVPAVAAISHDSDLNVDDHAITTLALLRRLKTRTTWCMMEPGYSPSFYEEMKRDKHDIALHYNALELDGGRWGEEEFGKQCVWLKKAAGISRISTNKNHYTRYEGWDELFKWCERNGIESDQTRGPSKNGNIGFLFGTCHPYYPISDYSEGNRLFNVLQIGFLSQDLNHPELYDSSVIEPFLDVVQASEGAAHFLFHQAHIHNFGSVRDAVAQVVEGAAKRGFAMWTIDEINQWERARRHVWITGIDAEGKPIIEGVPSPQPVTVYVPVGAHEPDDGEPSEIKFGVKCKTYALGERGR